jgi:hypothetical protein
MPCANPIVPSPFLNPANEPNYTEAGSLIAPFFYKDTADPATDNELTFFVQPSLTETLLLEWEWWAVPISGPIGLPQAAAAVPVIPQVPIAVAGPVPEPDPVYSLHELQDRTDWVTHPSTVLNYGGVLVNRTGGINVRPSATALGASFLEARVNGVAGLAIPAITPIPGQHLTVVGAHGVGPAELASLARHKLGNHASLSRPGPLPIGGAS